MVGHQSQKLRTFAGEVPPITKSVNCNELYLSYRREFLKSRASFYCRYRGRSRIYSNSAPSFDPLNLCTAVPCSKLHHNAPIRHIQMQALQRNPAGLYQHLSCPRFVTRSRPALRDAGSTVAGHLGDWYDPPLSPHYLEHLPLKANTQLRASSRLVQGGLEYTRSVTSHPLDR